MSDYVLFHKIFFLQSIATRHFEYRGLNNDGQVRETSSFEGHLTRKDNLKANADKPSLTNFETKPFEMSNLYSKS